MRYSLPFLPAEPVLEAAAGALRGSGGGHHNSPNFIKDNSDTNIISQSIYPNGEIFSHRMTPRQIFLESRRKPVRVSVALCGIILVGMLIAGCTITPLSDNQTVNLSTSPEITPTIASKALYKVTIAQQGGSHSDLIRMESDVFNQGEVIEFSLVTDGQAVKPCDGGIFSFRVFFRLNNGSWNELQGPFRAYIAPKPTCPAVTNAVCQQSLPPAYRFVTTGWPPGLYRIQSDCLNASHEFILRNTSSNNNSFSSQ